MEGLSTKVSRALPTEAGGQWKGSNSSSQSASLLSPLSRPEALSGSSKELSLINLPDLSLLFQGDTKCRSSGLVPPWPCHRKTYQVFGHFLQWGWPTFTQWVPTCYWANRRHLQATVAVKFKTISARYSPAAECTSEWKPVQVKQLFIPPPPPIPNKGKGFVRCSSNKLTERGKLLPPTFPLL